MIFPVKFRRAAVWLAVITLLLTGCRFGREENDLVYDLDAAVVNLDPQSASDTASLLVISSIFEGLVHVADDGTVSAGVAESWTQTENGYRFSLREDASWSDGTVLTASDFVFAFQRLLEPDTNAPYAEDFFAIENAREVNRGELEPEMLGVTAISPHELEIRLEEEDPDFLKKLDTGAAMPCSREFFEETKGKYGLEQKYIMGNGAFYLSSWAENGNLTLKPNREYYDAALVTATSVLLVSPKEERAPRKERFLDGTLSAAFFSGKDYEEIVAEDEYEFLQNDSAVWGMVFNTGTEPFSDIDLRQALFLDADFSTMETALPSYLEQVDYAVADNIEVDGQSYRKLAGYPDFPALSREEAKQACGRALARISTESMRGARMILPEGEGHETYFAYLSQIWQRDFGLYLTVEVLGQAEYEARLASGDFECALIRLSSEGGSPASALEQMKGGVYGCRSEGYAALLSEAADQSGKPAADTYLEAEQMLFSEYLFLPFYRQSEYFLLNHGISGIGYHFDTGFPDFRFGIVE